MIGLSKHSTTSTWTWAKVHCRQKVILETHELLGAITDKVLSATCNK